VATTTGGTTTSDLYDGPTLVQQSSGGSAVIDYLSTGAGGTVQVHDSAGTSVPLANQVGSTTALTGSTGQAVTSYSYDPAGNATSSGASNPDPERYAASLTDPTGLDQMGARYYDPAIGRFISPDPLGLTGGSVNPYEYAGDDPVSLNDPAGLCTVCQAIANLGAGFLNGATFGLFHIQPPYCGPGLGFAYGVGNILGGVATAIAIGGAAGLALRAIGGLLEAADAATVATDLVSTETDGLALGSAEDGGAARFITSSAGDTLDTSQVTIPEGKFGYLLDNPSKAGVFSDSMGFDQESLDTALRSHLTDNFGNASELEPMVGGGSKFSVTGPMTGPSGASWDITSVWGIDPGGLIRLITATP
jgi:RHS repeat-associated protein